MDISFFLKGLILGLSIAAPVGPIGVLCIRRTLARGRVYGFVSGMGAATADGIYGAIAGFGLTAVSNLLVGQRVWFGLVGGVFLCYLGLRTFLVRPDAQAPELGAEGNLLSAYASTFVLTLTNPMTILSFAAIFAGLGVGNEGESLLAAGVLVLGVFSGSALWWLALSGGVSLFRGRVGPQGLRWVNRISGAIITGFGLMALLSASGM